MEDPTRVFYESLLAERPDSPIAISYCVEHGTLPLERHVKLLEQYLLLMKKAKKRVKGRAPVS